MGLVFSTREAPARERVRYWNEAASCAFVPLETRPRAPLDFNAEMSVSRIGGLGLAAIAAEPAVVQRTESGVRRGGVRRFFLHVQASGRLLVRQDGREAWLEAGDMALADSSSPYALQHDDACAMRAVIIPPADLRQHLPTPEEMVAVRLPGDRGVSRILSGLVRSLGPDGLERLDADLGARLADSLLGLLAASWAEVRGGEAPDSAVCVSRRIQIGRYIEAHLRDPGLAPARIAEAFRISTRYLHMLFAAEDESVCACILRRRLEHCARQLLDPVHAGQTITDVAFSWGFNNATHFARVFKAHFQMSPRAYRALGGAPRQAGPAPH